MTVTSYRIAKSEALTQKLSRTLFRRKVEARYALLFDQLGACWDYRPRTYSLELGLSYTPSFQLHDVLCIHASEYKVPILNVETTLTITPALVLKMYSLLRYLPGYLIDSFVPEDLTPCSDEYHFAACSDEYHFAEEDEKEICFTSFNFDSIDGDYFDAWPGKEKDGGFALFGADQTYLSRMDEGATRRAYEIAAKAQLEVASAENNE